MNQPIHIRRAIPFFHDKTEAEFRQDPYERYDEVVVRHTALHLADPVWGGYPFQPLLDWVMANLPADKTDLPEGKNLQLADLGCGVGRVAGEMAQHLPNAKVWGLDFSYQMLRRAHEFWVDGETLPLDWSERGLPPSQVVGQHLQNLQFGLAKAEKLPFDNASLDVVVSTFLLDRLDEPLLALREMQRVLRPGGRMLLVSPLNFKLAENWRRFHPAGKLIGFLQNLDWEIESWQDDWQLTEPLDARGNRIVWSCVGLLALKQG